MELFKVSHEYGGYSNKPINFIFSQIQSHSLNIQTNTKNTYLLCMNIRQTNFIWKLTMLYN